MDGWREGWSWGISKSFKNIWRGRVFASLTTGGKISQSQSLGFAVIDGFTWRCPNCSDAVSSQHLIVRIHCFIATTDPDYVDILEVWSDLGSWLDSRVAHMLGCNRGLCIKMDDASSLPAAMRKRSQNISSSGSCHLARAWRRLESVQ